MGQSSEDITRWTERRKATAVRDIIKGMARDVTETYAGGGGGNRTLE